MPVPKFSVLRAHYVPGATSRDRHRLPPPEEGEVEYPSPMRPTGAKHQPYPGAPHGLAETHRDQLNADLLDFIRT